MNLEVSSLSKKFLKNGNPIVVLQDINLFVENREFVCVVGASGSGKSTLLRLIAGLDSPTSGAIVVDGHPVCGPGSDRGLVFQNYSLYPWMTVAENVGFGLKLQGFTDAERQQRVGYYLEVVGLAKFASAFPKTLSGGMQQRVAIARALASRPKILLMDEPFGALDLFTKESMQEFLLQLWQQTGTTILMITHDIEEAVFLAQRIYILSANPGTIAGEILISFPESRSFSLKKSRHFMKFKNQVSQLIRS
ncbi:MAG TPA: ABC transporter ATP-binding protein [Oscillatoriaceae cyanobacterium M33_DOE_052]|uniref:ABC transporter ATP-binding protein n=1 Tax=Planktothricoides sp. SpSt-374 TaxID=2282167 RepID=A0A7C3VJT3_9CYAN|nr:ABC transporter ATP-binding protein [Oscillatoriaceae cyanobacterium M33_DOE_052]